MFSYPRDPSKNHKIWIGDLFREKDNNEDNYGCCNSLEDTLGNVHLIFYLR